MKTLINDTIVDFTFDNYDKHLHGHLTNGRKPFMVGYIKLTSNEAFEPVRDEITVAVDIRLVAGLYPKYEMGVIDKVEFNENQAPCGGFGDDNISFILADLCDAIHYHELGETVDY